MLNIIKLAAAGLALALMLVSPAIAAEIPIAVRELKAAVGQLCGTYYINVGLRETVPNSSVSQYQLKGRWCGTAFQISDDKVVSVAHAVSDAPDVWAEEFDETGVHVVYSFDRAVDYTPFTGMVVEVGVNYSLVMSSGTYQSNTFIYKAVWTGESPSTAVNEAFLNSLVLDEEVVSSTKNMLAVERVDRENDLALLHISPVRRLKRYPTIRSWSPAHLTSVWEISATQAGRSSILVRPGSVETEDPFEWSATSDHYGSVPGWTIATQFPATKGHSGSFNVTEEGTLVGVTTATTILESLHVANLLSKPSIRQESISCDALACRTLITSPESTYEFLRDAP